MPSSSTGTTTNECSSSKPRRPWGKLSVADSSQSTSPKRSVLINTPTTLPSIRSGTVDGRDADGAGGEQRRSPHLGAGGAPVERRDRRTDRQQIERRRVVGGTEDVD